MRAISPKMLASCQTSTEISAGSYVVSRLRIPFCVQAEIKLVLYLQGFEIQVLKDASFACNDGNP